MEATFLAYCSTAAQKRCCVISVDVKQSQLRQFDVVSSGKELRILCERVCIWREFVCMGWGEERHQLCQSFTPCQNWKEVPAAFFGS